MTLGCWWMLAICVALAHGTYALTKYPSRTLVVGVRPSSLTLVNSDTFSAWKLSSKASNEVAEELILVKKFVPKHDYDDQDISFVVFGDPTSLSRHRVSRYGGMYNPQAKQQRLFLEASSKFLPDAPLSGPLEIKLIFYFGRPKCDYGKSFYRFIPMM